MSDTVLLTIILVTFTALVLVVVLSALRASGISSQDDRLQ